jgi:hypothetical protein
VQDDVFQIAAERARLRYTDEEWNAFSSKDRSAAIYREMRLLDAVRAPSSGVEDKHVGCPSGEATQQHLRRQ